jgi:hypothetical protein
MCFAKVYPFEQPPPYAWITLAFKNVKPMQAFPQWQMHCAFQPVKNHERDGSIYECIRVQLYVHGFN